MSHKLAVVVLVLAIGAAMGVVAQTPEELFVKAKQQIEDNSGEGASGTKDGLRAGIALLRQAIASGYPDRVASYRLLGNAVYTLAVVVPDNEREPLLAEAKVAFEQAIALAPTDADLLDDYTLVLDDPAARERVYADILKIDPRHSGALRGLGEVLIRRGEVEQGLARMRESVEVATKPLDIEYNGRALVSELQDRDRPQEAEAVKQLMAAKLKEPTSLEILTGDNQEGRVGTTVNRLAVEVWSLGRELVPGQTVAFAITSGSGSLSTTQVTTGADGVAATILTLGDTLGLVTVEARWRDQTVVFRITAVR